MFEVMELRFNHVYYSLHYRYVVIRSFFTFVAIREFGLGEFRWKRIEFFRYGWTYTEHFRLHVY